MDTDRTRRACWLLSAAALAALTSLVSLRPQGETGFAVKRDGSFWVAR
jgi:hypothetical protein